MKVKPLDENVTLDEYGNFVDSKYYNIYYAINYYEALVDNQYYNRVEVEKRKRIFPTEECNAVGKIDIDIDGEKSSKILMSAYKIIQRYDIDDAKSHIDELLEETEDANEIFYMYNAPKSKETVELIDILRNRLGNKLKDFNVEFH